MTTRGWSGYVCWKNLAEVRRVAAQLGGQPSEVSICEHFYYLIIKSHFPDYFT